MRSTVIGAIVGIFVVFFGVTNAINDYIILFNFAGLVLVLGGTFAAGVITFGVRDVANITRLSIRVFSQAKANVIDTINDMVFISSKMEHNPRALTSVLKNREKYHPFLADGLRLIESGMDRESIESIMVTDLEQRIELQLHQVEILKTLSKYPPAFGMVGTVIGLIGLLNGMTKDSETIIGPAMAIALITTLYGLLLANYFFIPMSDNLLHRLSADSLLRRTIIHGVTLLKENTETLILREKLVVYVPPMERKYVEIRESATT